jgi:formamidase
MAGSYLRLTRMLARPTRPSSPEKGADWSRAGLAGHEPGHRYFPETYRQLAWYGTEVLLQPTLTPTRDRHLELVVARANAIENQVFVVNVNAAAPHGTGPSLVVDPEGLVRQQAGGNEEIIIDVLDLNAVTRAHRYRTFGLNKMWEQMDRQCPRLHRPMYGGPYQPRPVPQPTR